MFAYFLFPYRMRPDFVPLINIVEYVMKYPAQLIRTIALKGDRVGEEVCLRPAHSNDISEIKSYIERMSDEERYMRYLSVTPQEALTKNERLQRLYDASLDYEGHMVFVVVNSQERIVGVAHAHGPVTSEASRFEVSYSRDAAYRGAGVGTALMTGLLLWGERAKIEGFYADTLHNNTCMRKLFQNSGFAWVSPHPDGEHTLVRYRYNFYAR